MKRGVTKLLGFDFGLRKIGVAVGQTLTRTANPVTTLLARRGKPDWAAIDELVLAWTPDALVVGLPLNMDGTEAEPAFAAKKFSRQLGQRHKLPVFLVDERLTSLEAKRELPLKADALDVDALAAKIILETWLSEYENAAQRD